MQWLVGNKLSRNMEEVAPTWDKGGANMIKDDEVEIEYEQPKVMKLMTC